MQAVKRLAREVDLTENRLRVLREQSSRFGHHNPAAVSDEQIMAQFKLEKPDLAT
jgi:hypothetical protein